MSGFKQTQAQNKQMDFFAEQRTRTQRSLLLYGLFVLIVLAHLLVGLGIMALLLTIFTGGIYYWVMVSVVVWILLSFGAGSLIEYRRLQAGGRAIAKRVGAARLFIDSSQDAWQHSSGVAHQHQVVSPVLISAQRIAVRHERDFPPLYRRYYEFAHQLAIASGISTPILYVLQNEQGINGFVAGRHSQDMVMVVTQGALEQLSDEGLYGLIGHEYGHIIHGDAKFNMQLMIVLAGLQILYDWSDPIDNHINGKRADSTRDVWALLLHGLSFSSMASAQLIKHSFNRQRELLADATSVQLTRSPAIVETLKTIHQNSLGSRLSHTADINGLSHFFFANSGADLGDVSWLATHPSLAERMSAINANEYRDFATQVAQQQRLNEQKIKEIYEQRRRGTWGELNENSLSSKNLKDNLASKLSEVKDSTLDHDKNSVLENIINGNSNDNGLEFTVESDVVIDGRLQINAEFIGTHKLLKPWQALCSADLLSDALITPKDIEQVSLPLYILNHSHHPLGALALIESIMLCHQQRALSTSYRYNLSDIWDTLSENFNETGELASYNSNNTASRDNESNINNKLLAHTIDYKLLTAVAKLDRRMDSAIIAMTMNKLQQHDLTLSTINELQRQSTLDHSHKSQQNYQQQLHARTMLLRYQQGLIELFNHELTTDLTDDIESLTDAKNTQMSASLINELSCQTSIKRNQSSILSLWQALHLQQLLPVLSTVLEGSTQIDIESTKIDTKSTEIDIESTKIDIESTEINIQSAKVDIESYQQTLLDSTQDIIAQLDPSNKVFESMSSAERMMIIIFAYRLANDTADQVSSLLTKQTSLKFDNKNYLLDIRRHARLIDVDLTAISDINLQWLLLTAQNLNSAQLLAIIGAGDNNKACQIAQNPSELAYNNDASINYQEWLSTLHTVMLHDTIISQDEYDCLTMLAEQWLGVRQLID